jgi:HSP20 family protein
MAPEPAKRDLFSHVEQMRREMELMMENMFAGPRPRPWTPEADVYESPDAVVVCLDVPGADPARISIEIRGGRLIIQGERRRTAVERGARLLRVERHHGRFLKSLELHADVDADRAEVKEEDGTLIIRLPKRGVARDW